MRAQHSYDHSKGSAAITKYHKQLVSAFSFSLGQKLSTLMIIPRVQLLSVQLQLVGLKPPIFCSVHFQRYTSHKYEEATALDHCHV